MNRWIRSATLVMTTALLAACGGAEEEPEVVADAPAAAEPAAPMGGMQGMEGMDGMQMDGGMMELMQAHMRMMEGATGDGLMAMMPEHRQMAANMLADMNRQMREMNMAADPEWDETVSALRQDLTRLPEMSAQEVQAFLPEHRARVERLMEMHRAMRGNMQM